MIPHIKLNFNPKLTIPNVTLIAESVAAYIHNRNINCVLFEKVICCCYTSIANQTSSFKKGPEHLMAKKPNIIFLMTDQQRFDTVGALGNSVIQTPALDRIVREGTSFTSAYCPSPVVLSFPCVRGISL